MFIIAALLACSGDDPEPSATADTTDTAVAVKTYEPTWDGVQELFEDHCDSCHPATNGLDLRAGIDAYVVPGDSAASDLWISVSGQSLSTMMPPSGILDPASVAHVQQ